MDAMQDPTKLLKTAVDDIVHRINTDRLPAHDAVVKTAKELDLNVHFIKRACEVVNVALTYEHFRKNAAQRDTDFPIVDAQKVAAEIFPDKEATLPEKKSQMFAGTFVEEEVPNFLKAKYNQKHKEAFAKLATQVEPAREMSDQGICEKAGHARLNLTQRLDNCRTVLVGAKQDLASKFAALVNVWSKEASARASFADFESQVFSKYGEASVPYLDFIYTTSKVKEARGEHDSKHTAFDDSRETEMFGTFLGATEKVALALVETGEAASDVVEIETKRANAYRTLGEARLLALREETEELPKEATEKKNEELDAEDPVLKVALEKMAADAASAIVAASVASDETKHLSENQRSLPAALKARILQSKKFAAETEKDAGITESLWTQFKEKNKPSIPIVSNSPLDNLDRKLLLQNLLTTDPILRTYEPKHVADSYEQFLRLAPELSNEKEIVRSHLRQMVASQAMSAFDGAQLMDANTKLLKQRMLETGAKPPPDSK